MIRLNAEHCKYLKIKYRAGLALTNEGDVEFMHVYSSIMIKRLSKKEYIAFTKKFFGIFMGDPRNTERKRDSQNTFTWRVNEMDSYFCHDLLLDDLLEKKRHNFRHSFSFNMVTPRRATITFKLLNYWKKKTKFEWVSFIKNKNCIKINTMLLRSYELSYILKLVRQFAIAATMLPNQKFERINKPLLKKLFPTNKYEQWHIPSTIPLNILTLLRKMVFVHGFNGFFDLWYSTLKNKYNLEIKKKSSQI